MKWMKTCVVILWVSRDILQNMDKHQVKGYSCVQCILHRSEAGQGSLAAATDQSAKKARAETRLANTSPASSVLPDDTVL